MTAKTHEKWLRKSIESILIPEIEGMGFERIQKPSRKESAMFDFQQNPFEKMIRIRNGNLHLIQITHPKYDKSFFNIMFSSIEYKKDGYYINGSKYKINEVEVYWFPEYWSMYEYPIINENFVKIGYFGLCLKSIRDLGIKDYENLVKRVAGYLPEIDDSLVLGKKGRHMRHVYIGDSKFHLSAT